MADVDLESLSYNELRSLAKQRGLHAGGKKVEILERLVNSAPNSPKRSREDGEAPSSPHSDGEEPPAKRMAAAGVEAAAPDQASSKTAEPAAASAADGIGDDDEDIEAEDEDSGDAGRAGDADTDGAAGSSSSAQQAQAEQEASEDNQVGSPPAGNAGVADAAVEGSEEDDEVVANEEAAAEGTVDEVVDAEHAVDAAEDDGSPVAADSDDKSMDDEEVVAGQSDDDVECVSAGAGADASEASTGKPPSPRLDARQVAIDALQPSLQALEAGSGSDDGPGIVEAAPGSSGSSSSSSSSSSSQGQQASVVRVANASGEVSGEADPAPSRFVHLSNLVRPLTASRLEAWVRSLAGSASVAAPAAQGEAGKWLWIHPLKTDAVVALATEEAAALVRKAANGAKFPAGRVDGGLVAATFSAQSPEEAGADAEAERSRARAEIASRVEHLPMPAAPVAAPEAAPAVVSPAVHQPAAVALSAVAVPAPVPQREVVQVVQQATDFAPPLPHAASAAAKCPDELFRRTATVPPLYWSPVPGHVAKRAKERATSQFHGGSRRGGAEDE